MVFLFRFYDILDSIQFFNLSYVTNLTSFVYYSYSYFQYFFVIEIPVVKNRSNVCKYFPPIMKNPKSRRFLPFVNLRYVTISQNLIYYFRNYFENSFEKQFQKNETFDSFQLFSVPCILRSWKNHLLFPKLILKIARKGKKKKKD